MHERITVAVHATDPISEAGIAAQLRTRSELRVLDDASQPARVAVVVTDEISHSALQCVKSLHRQGDGRVVLVVTVLDDAGLLSATEAGVSGFVRRNEATPESLAEAVHAAHAGSGTLPPDLLGRLLDQVGRLQRNVLRPRGLTFSGLTEREVAVLRLVADGLDTGEVARLLAYSERTVKNVIHDVTTRLNLRNRTHAVAYAVREGLI